ncbi:phospholipase D zeta 1-like [Cynara cardunculus var. scolymus]|uniref:phospholipase D zeta 1-like n=1 Tax=Cynara cardunculus var. scolymus TaxID=59895 RepID=UPI000D62D56D|nr:phospholipase D zeta 1-like [Cynara cardunculus var. scolymus]
MANEQLMPEGGSGSRYLQMQSEPSRMSSFFSLQNPPEASRIFDELPKATIVQVSRHDAGDISPALLSYTIDFQYKQFKWQLVKKASHVFYLHFALKKRAFIEEIHEKQEQVKEWLQNLGIMDHHSVVHDDLDEPPDDDVSPVNNDESVKNRDVPSRAALPIIRPALGRQHSMSDRAKTAMQGYLNHFLGNLDIANSREVCRFLEASKLSFCPEYGSKHKEEYVWVKHLPNFPNNDDRRLCSACQWLNCCNDTWQQVWAVLKPGFLALLKDPFDKEPLDIIVFDVLPSQDGNGEGRMSLANEINERNPLRHSFEVSSGNRRITLRCRTKAKAITWVVAINDAGLRPPEGWCHPHRFGSFAPPRGLTDDDSQAQWFVDGRAAFDAIALAMEEAKSEIFMCGWWLCPELYLRRPFHSNATTRLDALLEAKAKQGVQIYILMYKELALALKINSFYSKKKLAAIHENVKVLRYPDHFSSGVYLWSHHEKLVIVDNEVCFIGGLDLCFGRYDTYEHKVGDRPPMIWPGKDYYNPRESEPNSWEDTLKDELNREKYPRMPWHDVHCALWGPPCRDIARHFVQRWNYAKRNKAPNEQTIPLLMPQQHMVIPHYMGTSREQEDGNTEVLDVTKAINRQDSYCSLSSFQDIPLLIPQEADGLDASSGHTSQQNGLGKAHNVHGQQSRMPRTRFYFRKSKSEPLGSDMPMRGFVDEQDTSTFKQARSAGTVVHPAIKSSDREWWETQERGNLVVSADETGQVGPRAICRCQIIRSVSLWSAGTSQVEDSIHNAYCSLIEKAEHFVYIENQFFISGLSGDEIIRNRVLDSVYRRIMRAHQEKQCFRVIVVIPLLPGFQGGLDDGGAASVRAIMHWQYRTISRGHNSILHNLSQHIGPKVHDYISFYGLRAYGRLSEDGLVASSPVYVHSKIMIVDDNTALVGSANINDRSLLGLRDSEIGVLIEDKEVVESYMGGNPWRAGKFALSLRLSLWSEHLGLHSSEMSKIADPVIDSTYKDIWIATAKTNTMIYQDVFSCIPNDLIHSRASLRQCMSELKGKLGHNTIDLGIAPKKLEAYQDGNGKGSDPIDRLEGVKGHLVSFPLDFMCKEDLRPVFKESEYYASPQVFH